MPRCRWGLEAKIQTFLRSSHAASQRTTMIPSVKSLPHLARWPRPKNRIGPGTLPSLPKYSRGTGKNCAGEPGKGLETNPNPDRQTGSLNHCWI
jgi:hypothetical protein